MLAIADFFGTVFGLWVLGAAAAAPGSPPPHDELIGVVAVACLGAPVALALASGSVIAALVVTSAPKGLRIATVVLGITVLGSLAASLLIAWVLCG